MSESNQVLLRYILESSYGTTPTNSSLWRGLEYTSEDLGGEQSKSPSEIVNNNRIPQDVIELSRTVGGNIDFELRAGWYDDLILAAMCGDAWNTDVATLGTTDHSFSVEKEFADLPSGNRFMLFDGLRVAGMSLDMQYGRRVTGQFQFAGSAESSAATSAVGTGSETSQSSSKRSIAAAKGFGSFEIDGSPNNAEIMSATFSINNNMEARNALGSIAAVNQDKGDGDVSGVLVAYLDVSSLALFDRTRNETVTQITFRLTESTSGDYYEIDIPAAQLSARTPRSQGRNQRVMVELDYSAHLSATTITRSVS